MYNRRMSYGKGYHIITYGCQMNKHDSERMAGVLESDGWVAAQNVFEADLVVFNTCCVREHADNRLYGNVSRLKTLKRTRPELLIAVGGCLAQKERESLLARLPHVDVVFGTHNLPELPQLLRRAGNGKAIAVFREDSEGPPTDLPWARNESWRAWVPITKGCNNYCTYCVVPYVRGREKSRSIDDVTAEVTGLADQGVTEITLLGQNVNSFGADTGGHSLFAELLGRLNQVKGLARIRFTTSHPKDLGPDIISAVHDNDKVCEHIHLPFQAGSTRVLEAMNRRYTKEQYVELVARVRQAVPGVSITTDIMVGFPGETEADFLDTLDVVERVRFDSAFTFIYSPRSGTPAAKMPDQVPHEVKAERIRRLVDLQNSISLEKNMALVGAEVEVQIEGTSKKDPGCLSGRTRTNKIVNIPQAPAAIPEGVRRADVAIERAFTFYLVGRPLPAGSRKSA